MSFVNFEPLKGSKFEWIQVNECKYPSGKFQVFQPVVKVDIRDFLSEGKDFTKASQTYYPFAIRMKADSPALKYETIYYLQLAFRFQQGWAL